MDGVSLIHGNRRQLILTFVAAYDEVSSANFPALTPTLQVGQVNLQHGRFPLELVRRVDMYTYKKWCLAWEKLGTWPRDTHRRHKREPMIGSLGMVTSEWVVNKVHLYMQQYV